MTCRCARRDGPRAHCRIPHGTALVAARGPIGRHRCRHRVRRIAGGAGKLATTPGHVPMGRLIATLLLLGLASPVAARLRVCTLALNGPEEVDVFRETAAQDRGPRLPAALLAPMLHR